MLNSLVERRRQMVLVPNSIHSKKADDEIASRTLYIDQNRLKLINCILFSILIKLPDSDDVRRLFYYFIYFVGGDVIFLSGCVLPFLYYLSVCYTVILM